MLPEERKVIQHFFPSAISGPFGTGTFASRISLGIQFCTVKLEKENCSKNNILLLLHCWGFYHNKKVGTVMITGQ